MATKTDQFYLIDPFNPPPPGTSLNVQDLQVTDADDDGQLESNPWWDPQADTIDGSRIVGSYQGDTVTVQFEDGTTKTITGTTFYLADGREVFTPIDGSTLEDAVLIDTTWVSTSTPTPYPDLDPLCFAAGTRIETKRGPTPVETLQPGNTVIGHAGERLTLRKVLHSRFALHDIRANPKLRPVRISAGALGHGLPLRDLLVSRQHRMLVTSKIAHRMFGVPEVLIPAIRLTDLPGIFVDETIEQVDYFHLLFDRHEVIVAEGTATESLFIGPQALKSLDPEARKELLTIFPDCADQVGAAEPARLIPTGRLQKKLVARHLKNAKPLYQLATAGADTRQPLTSRGV